MVQEGVTTKNVVFTKRLLASLTIGLFSCVALGLILYLSFASAAIVSPEIVSPDLEVTPLFDGYYKDGFWVGLEITLKNGNNPAWQGEVRASLPYDLLTNYAFTHQAKVEPNATNKFILYVLPTRFEAFEVGLYSSKEQLLKTQTVRLKLVTTTDYLVGVLANPKQPFTLPKTAIVKLTQRDYRAIFVPLPPLNLIDTPIGLESLKVLIVGDADLSQVPPSFTSTLLSWVAEGGRLWFAADSPFTTLIEQTALGLVPTRLQGKSQTNLLEAIIPPDTVLPKLQGQISLNEMIIQDDTKVTMRRTNGNPLVVGRAYGRGSLISTAFNLLEPPFSTINKTVVDYWNGVLEASNPGSEHLTLQQEFYSLTDVSRQLSIKPPVRQPDLFWLLIAVTAYMLVLAPGGYWVSHQLKKPLLMWTVVPLLAIGVSSIILVQSGTLAAGQTYLDRISLVSFNTDEVPATINSYALSRGEGSGDYAIALSGNLLYRPHSLRLDNTQEAVTPPNFFAQVTPQITNSYAHQLQAFGGQGIFNGKFKLDSALRITPDGRSIVGSLTNHSGWNVSEAILVLGDNYYPLGNLDAGEQRNISFPLKVLPTFLPQQNIPANLYRANSSDSNPNVGEVRLNQWQENVRWMMLNAAYLNGRFATQYQSYDLFLTGWVDGAGAADFSGTARLTNGQKLYQQNSAIVVKPLTLALQPDAAAGKVIIPAASLVSTRLENINTKPITDGGVRMGSNSSIIMQYQVPGSIKLRPTKLTLFVRAGQENLDGWQATPRLEIYNWTDKLWKQVSLQGDTREQVEISGADLANFVEPFSGAVRVRATNDTEIFILQQMNLEVQALLTNP